MWDLSWLIQRLSPIDILDICLVAALFFWLFYALRGTRAIPLVRGVTVLVISLAMLSRLVPLRAFSWLVQQLSPAILVAVPILFQPELRRALEHLGRGGFLPIGQRNENIDLILNKIVEAAKVMAGRNVGALIVFERKTGLQEYIETGIVIDAEVSKELLTTIFDHHTVLHDGAVIIREGRVYAASCVMPLTSAFLSDRHLGLRHRAALGITEESDAIAIVVSEERGAISVTHDGRIIRDLNAKRLTSVLKTFLDKSTPKEKRILGRTRHKREH
ncbi:MAG: diadenylate cyclase CdaA [Anaerolineae bacterium]|nr:diadenylate cyclase CdaA [Anaerolineae bacterium]